MVIGSDKFCLDWITKKQVNSFYIRTNLYSIPRFYGKRPSASLVCYRNPPNTLFSTWISSFRSIGFEMNPFMPLSNARFLNYFKHRIRNILFIRMRKNQCSTFGTFWGAGSVELFSGTQNFKSAGRTQYNMFLRKKNDCTQK